LNDTRSGAVPDVGVADATAVGGWFSGAGSQLAGIKTADGMTLDTGVSQLVQAMAAYSSANADFDPTAVTQAPADTSLQNTLAASWHH